MAASTLIVLVGCASPMATYQVPVTIQNHTSAAVQLVVTDNAQRPGEQIGSASPQLVPAFDYAQVTLVVPGSRPWALFIFNNASGDRWRALRDEQLGGCRTFTIPISIEVSIQGGAMHVPSGLC